MWKNWIYKAVFIVEVADRGKWTRHVAIEDIEPARVPSFSFKSENNTNCCVKK